MGASSLATCEKSQPNFHVTDAAKVPAPAPVCWKLKSKRPDNCVLVTVFKNCFQLIVIINRTNVTSKKSIYLVV